MWFERLYNPEFLGRVNSTATGWSCYYSLLEYLLFYCPREITTNVLRLGHCLQYGQLKYGSHSFPWKLLCFKLHIFTCLTFSLNFSERFEDFHDLSRIYFIMFTKSVSKLLMVFNDKTKLEYTSVTIQHCEFPSSPSQCYIVSCFMNYI